MADLEPPPVPGVEGWALGRMREPDPADLAADLSPDPARPIRLETIATSPRVRLLHNFITSSEAAELIRMAEPLYHRSGTARANGDISRTSFSASLPSSHAVVSAVRHRIARFSGYPEANLEPLQTVRQGVGQWRLPHPSVSQCTRAASLLLTLRPAASGSLPRRRVLPPTPRLLQRMRDLVQRYGRPGQG